MRKNETTFGGLYILGHHQQDDISFTHQIARDSLLTKILGKLFEDSIEDTLNAGTLFGTDHNGSLPALLFNPKHHGSGVLTGIGFIQYQYHGDFARCQQL